jgi:Ca2+-binding RTX toxin-like protein
LRASLSDDDAALFEVFDGDLYLKAGTVLDFEGGNTTLDVTVAVDDPDVGGSPDGSAALSISVSKLVGETWGAKGFRGAQTHTGTGEEDNLTGGTFNDTLDGGGGNDTINAGAGNDIVMGGTGNDTMNGGAGNDVFIFGAGFGNDRILQFDEPVRETGPARHFRVRSNGRQFCRPGHHRRCGGGHADHH